MALKFEKGVKSIGDFTRHEENYKLFILMILFLDTEAVPSLKILQKHLFSVIQRRQNARYSSESTLTAASSFRSKSPSEDLIGGLFSGIPIVKEIAMLWASMSEPPPGAARDNCAND